MKPILFLFIWIPFVSFSQDIIVKKNGDELKTKIIEINDENIKYKEFDFQEGPLRNVKISQVFIVLYQNGKRENFIDNRNKEKKPTLIEKKKIESINSSKNDKFLIKGINEKQFVRSDYKGELIDSYFFVFNLTNFSERLWSPYRNEMFNKTSFQMLPPPEQYSKTAYDFLDIEMIKNKMELLIKEEIEYAFNEPNHLKNTIDNMVAKVLGSMQDNSDHEPCTVLGITIPIELNPKKNKKPKYLKTKLIEFIIIPYINKTGEKTVRIYNSSKIGVYASDYGLNVLIGGKDCHLCSKSVMLKNIKTWYDQEYLLEINENSPNSFINFSN